MVIIIEGPDGSGKTTLANMLSTQTGYPIIHNVQPKTPEEKAEMWRSYIELIKSGRNLILDRAWYSEMVYGPIMRGASALDYPLMYELERAVAKRGGMVIYCRDNPEVLWRRATKRGEDFVKDYGTFVEICESFDDVMGVPHLIPVVKYDYKDL